ncbi:MAG: PLP-dependent aminotransferase family protein [Gemmataceae bacterium]
MSPASVRLSQRSHQTADQPVSYFMQQAVENPHLISLAAGLVDPVSLPGSQIETAIHEILSKPQAAQAALQYGTTHGYAPLRETLLKRTCALDGVTPSDLSLSASNVVVTTGSQQFLYLITEVLINPGDIVITEAPSYFVYHGTLASLGAKVLSVPMDEDGMQTEALEELLERLVHTGEIDRLRMIYTIDYFQNPSSLTLSYPRRQHLMELVRNYSREHRIFVLEDAAYRELRYDGEDVPSIKSLDEKNEYVIKTMTFSKPCSPGLKTGYGFLPAELVGPLLRFKGNHDFGSNNLTQHLLHRLLESGAYDEHVTELCDVYRTKRDATLNGLTEVFGTDGIDASHVRWTHPEGGLYVWMTFPEGVDTGPNGPLMKAALDEGLLYVPGQFCFVQDGESRVPGNDIRLSFGVEQPDTIREGLLRLARAISTTYPELMVETSAGA